MFYKYAATDSQVAGAGADADASDAASDAAVAILFLRTSSRRLHNQSSNKFLNGQLVLNRFWRIFDLCGWMLINHFSF